jgi:predicted amidophosphoribosyltransferase
MPISDALHALVDLVLPLECGGCRSSVGPLCGSCRQELNLEPRSAWPRPVPAGLPEPFAAGTYAGVLRSALIAYKERGRRRLAPVLSEFLATSVRLASTAGERYLLVPVPSRRQAIRERGDDTMARLARLAAARVRRAGVTARMAPVLRHTRDVVDQAGLDGLQRLHNLSGALAVHPAWRAAITGRQVILLDDILTTGATLAEAARAARVAGAVVVAAAVVAAVDAPTIPNPVRSTPPAH